MKVLPQGKSSSVSSKDKAAGGIIAAEERAVGAVQWSVYKKYLGRYVQLIELFGKLQAGALA
jgi:hypothetical protein